MAYISALNNSLGRTNTSFRTLCVSAPYSCRTKVQKWPLPTCRGGGNTRLYVVLRRVLTASQSVVHCCGWLMYARSRKRPTHTPGLHASSWGEYTVHPLQPPSPFCPWADQSGTARTQRAERLAASSVALNAHPPIHTPFLPPDMSAAAPLFMFFPPARARTVPGLSVANR